MTLNEHDANRTKYPNSQNGKGKEHIKNKDLMGAGALARLLSPVKGYLMASATLAMLGAALGLSPYIAIAEIMKQILKNNDTEMIWLWLIVGIAGAGLRLALTYWSSRLGHFADAELLHKIRIRIVNRLGAIPLGWFRENGSGAIKKVMTTDLEEMHQLIAHSIREIIGAVTVVFVGIGYLLMINWQMALVSMTVLGIMYLSFRISMRSASTHMDRLLVAETKISTTAVEYADGITVVKTFGVGGRLLSRFGDAVGEYTNAFKDWVSETKFSSAFSRVFASEVTLLSVIATVGLWYVSSGQLAVADLLPFLIVGIGLPTTIVPAVHGSQGLRKGRLCASNIGRVLTQQTIMDPELPLVPQHFNIAFDKVSFAYAGMNDVLREISFECPAGTITALVGPSGSGKSTIAHLLPRFYDVSEGRITVGGVDIRSIASEKLLGSMSLVFQDIVLLKDTVRENIRVALPHATDAQIIYAARTAYIHDVIMDLPQGYDTILGSGTAGLSGGERQRLTIARAILSNAPIVVLDEATASLDPDNEMLVQRALSALVKEKTVLMIAHRLHTIRNAHQIIVLQNGKITERGTHQQLLQNQSLYTRLWEAQQHALNI